MGGKSASAALNLLNIDMSAKEMYEACRLLYADSIETFGAKTGYEHLGAKGALLENARLLWMLEYPGQLWTPPGKHDETFTWGQA